MKCSSCDVSGKRCVSRVAVGLHRTCSGLQVAWHDAGAVTALQTSGRDIIDAQNVALQQVA